MERSGDGQLAGPVVLSSAHMRAVLQDQPVIRGVASEGGEAEALGWRAVRRRTGRRRVYTPGIEPAPARAGGDQPRPRIMLPGIVRRRVGGRCAPAGCCAVGIVKKKLLPWPGVLSTHTRPPCAST